MRRAFLRTVLLGLGVLSATPLRAGEADELARYDARIKPAAREHWAFQPVRPKEAPRVRDAAWVRNPIDAFVLARLESRGWKPSPPAPPRALLRRVYLDVIGLPPTVAEQEAFETDPSPRALDGVVDRLLARPEYGERWARHWLDLVRYADTNGYERDADKPGVWRYRDYVIRAFNADKPYDRFVLEQLAGDELPDASAETLLATGFCRLGPWDDEPADPTTDQFDQLDDIVSTTSQVFLGLTLGCARCHNHKFEPLSLLDYYRMVAVFRPLRRPRAGRKELAVPALTHQQQDELAADRRRLAGLRAAQVGLWGSFVPAVVTEERIGRVRAALPQAPPGYFLQESPQAPPTHLLLRGQASRPGPQVEPGVPAVLVARQPDFPPPDAHTTRRRLTLARWIASPGNPLTARVLVNRVWQVHFGEGLVRTPSEFGTRGERPTHPELLDWLADWFVREGWSIKKLNRLILTSNTYRMSKRRDAARAAEDPEDRLLWRVPYRRLEVEAIRDAMLAVSGRLNRQMYGPSVFPPVPREALAGHSDPNTVWKASDEHTADRRTIYVHVKRSLVLPLLEVLDFCDTARTSARRAVTTVAPQALTLYNGEFVNRQARHFAARLEREAGPDPARQIEHAYRLALCRPPTPQEREALLHFLRGGAKGGAVPRAAREQMCRVILNLNEFLYPD